ncbi:MAG: tryptophan-rich sensory protein [Rhodobacteraceae bacterium]|nr:tryptophan-rich sensory protein [Paracoccaceae bacterium]
MDWGLFLIFLGACAAAGTTGAAFPPGAWYERLDKPAWTPPNWLFPIAWTALYIAMAAAAARVAVLPGNAHAMAFWALQIALNTLWTPVFFGLRRMKAGLAVLACLWVAVAATCLTFFQHDALAGWLLVPYVVWVSYAGALNAALVRRNRDPLPAG